MRSNRHGGSCILVKNGIRAKNVEHVNQMSIINLIGCSAIELIDHKIYILCIYRPPNQIIGSLNTFFIILSKILRKLVKSNGKNIIICGDFNIDIAKQSKTCNEFVELLLSFNVMLQFNQITCSASN